MKQTEAETVEDTMDTADMKEERRDRDGSDRFCCYDVSQPVIGPVTAEVRKLFNQKYFYISWLPPRTIYPPPQPDI